jgi:L-threonylcarbamoyladenylate synthase
METLVYHRDELLADSGKLEKAAEIIRQGGLAIIPTETVYGIAARGDEGGFEALRAVKPRDDSKFYTVHIPSPEALENYVPSVDMRTAKLVHNFWPGPVTIVFNLDEKTAAKQKSSLGKRWQGVYKDNTIGVRCPDNDVCSSILELAQVPVVATSANLTGKPAATDFEQAFKEFNGKYGGSDQKRQYRHLARGSGKERGY